MHHQDTTLPSEQSAILKKQHVSFLDVIPYKPEATSSETYRMVFTTFPKSLEATNHRDHIAVAICIDIIALFSTITQLMFIIYGAAPYRWISLAFFVIAQLISFILCFVLSISVSQLSNKVNVAVSMICLFIFLPLSPIIISIFMECKGDYDWLKLIVKSAPSLAIAALQSYPQIIILIVMLATDHQLNNNDSAIFYWSFVASCLSIIAMSIQIASIFEQREVFLINTVWLLFDFVLTLTIICAIFYDSTTRLIFYVDSALYGIWLMPLLIIVGIMLKCVGRRTWHVLENQLQISESRFINVVICIGGSICFVVIILFVIMLGLIGIVALSVYLHSFTLFWFFIMDQLYQWNVFPMSFRFGRFGDHESLMRYILLEWICNGRTVEERSDRLYSVNIVILDNDKILNAMYSELCCDMMENIRESIRSNEKSVHQMTSMIDSFFVLRFEFEGMNELNDELGKLSSILKCTMIYFPINRILHLIVPFVIMVYIAYSVQWNIVALDFFLQILLSLLLILLIICIISICFGWKSLNYNRLVLPINLESDGMNMQWSTFQRDIAYCYYYITALKIIGDWCERRGGYAYIAYLILGFSGLTQAKQQISNPFFPKIIKHDFEAVSDNYNLYDKAIHIDQQI